MLARLANTIAATFLVSLVSLTGILALSLKEGTLHRILFVLIALSAGSILGAAYLDLLPKAIELFEESYLPFRYITVGFIAFFFLKRFVYWYHGHPHEADVCIKAPSKDSAGILAYLKLIGDGVHHFIDRMIIGASFLVGFSFGKTAETLSPILIALLAGGFLYLSTSELTPELHRAKSQEILNTVYYISSWNTDHMVSAFHLSRMTWQTPWVKASLRYA